MKFRLIVLWKFILWAALDGSLATKLPSVSENINFEPDCTWTDPRALRCQIGAIDEHFSGWMTQQSWPVDNARLPSSSPGPNPGGSQMYRDGKRVTSLTVECVPPVEESLITETTFKGLEKMTALEIVNCKLTSIPRGTIVNLSQLKEVKVTSMKREWPDVPFKILTNSLPSSLEEINLSHNNIEYVPPTAFCGCKSLFLLDLSHNSLRSVEEIGLGTKWNAGKAMHGYKVNSTEGNSEGRRKISQFNTFTPLGDTYNEDPDFIEYDFSASTFELENVSGVRSKDVSHSESIASEKHCGKSLKSLALDHNVITRLRPGSFHVLSNLHSLSISSNYIEEISDDAFKGLESLQVLDLSNNRVRAISTQNLRSLVRMEKLLLGNNSLAELSVDVFTDMSGLHILDLSSNKLTLTEGYENIFLRLRRLVILNLSHNLIQNMLPNMFDDLSGLQKLDMSHNMISVIDEKVFQTMFNLYELNLSNNRIVRLSKSCFSGLLGLNLLNLNNNSLIQLHPNILQQSSNLKSLILSNNKFENIPIAAQNLSFLNHLDISHNNILQVEMYNFERLSNLQILNLSSNIINNITVGSFKGLKSLKILDLSDNNIEHVVEGPLDSILGLRELFLARNKFANINGLFAGMEHLHLLDLSENFISMFDYAFLPRQLLKLNLRNNYIKQLGNHFKVHDVLALEEIDASFNNIQTISEISLPNTIRRVSLEQNKIREVKPGTFREKLDIELINLRMNLIAKLNPKAVSPEWVTKKQEQATLYLGGNSLDCDCEMKWLHGDSSRTNETNYRLPIIGDLSDVVCSLPHSTGNLVTYSKIADTTPDDYLCPYATHCFTLCNCCDFIACDCQMKCPNNCSCFRDDTWSINLVDCSRRYLHKLPDKVPMDATVVFLDDNNMNVLHAHRFIGRHSMQQLFLNNSNIQTIQNRTFHGLSSLKILYLQDNLIAKLNGFEFQGLTNLKELYLHNNKISFLHNNTFVGLKTMEVLRLDNNFIVNFPVWVLSKNVHLNNVFLINNPWDCSCEFTHKLSQWISSKNDLISNPEELFCIVDSSGTIWSGIIEPDFICVEESEEITHEKFDSTELPFLAGGLCGGALIITAIIFSAMILARKRGDKGQKFRNSPPLVYSQEEDGKIFDAYIVYSVSDTNFTKDILAYKMENGSPNYKLCLHNRDYNEASLPEFISQSICFSRKIIIVLSRSFLENEWKNVVFRKSLLEALKSRVSSVIVINFDGIADTFIESHLRTIIKKSYRVLWGDKYFWKKLGDILPLKSVYSGFSLYISDPLYKSQGPFLTQSRGISLPSSSSVLTNTTGLTTPSEHGRSSFLQDQLSSYKAPPPPRPCNPPLCDYIYLTNREVNERSCHCQGIAPSLYSSAEGDSNSVHTYNSLEVFSHHILEQHSSTDSNQSHSTRYSAPNLPESPHRKDVQRSSKCLSTSPPIYSNSSASPSSGMLNNVIPFSSICNASSFPHLSLSGDVDDEDILSGSSSTAGVENSIDEGCQRTDSTLQRFPSDECFV